MGPDFSWMRRMADHADLTDEILPGQTVIELVGEGRVWVEGHDGVSAYSDDEVDVKVIFGVVKIAGCNLKLTQMSTYKLIISGDVMAVRLVRRGQK